jgi:uncharacterized protein YndB with AHSA1/START domain
MSDLSLLIRRTIRAPIDRVFAAWTEPAQIVSWWGPEGVSCPGAEVDLRPGSYFVDVGIYEREWQYAYDYHWHVYPLEIRRAESHKSHRTVPHRWSVPD